MFVWTLVACTHIIWVLHMFVQSLVSRTHPYMGIRYVCLNSYGSSTLIYYGYYVCLFKVWWLEHTYMDILFVPNSRFGPVAHTHTHTHTHNILGITFTNALTHAQLLSYVACIWQPEKKPVVARSAHDNRQIEEKVSLCEWEMAYLLCMLTSLYSLCVFLWGCFENMPCRNLLRFGHQCY